MSDEAKGGVWHWYMDWKFFASVILITVIICLASTICAINNPGNNYWAPGSNIVDSYGQPADHGAPNGVYVQKDWGTYDSQNHVWSFAMCNHDYLGPLHGSWKVANNVSVPIWSIGNQSESRLLITIQNNIIVKVDVQLEYGN